MKITEIIDDLKRLNAYLPTDPDKKYPDPLERMARELWLIREFALAGNQQYASVMLELSPKNRDAAVEKFTNAFAKAFEKEGFKGHTAVLALRRAILREYKNHYNYPMRFDELKSLSGNTWISCAPGKMVLAQAKELYMHGFLELAGPERYRITQRGLRQLDPECDHSVFVEDPNDDFFPWFK